MKYLKTIINRSESFIDDDRKEYPAEVTHETSGRALGEYPDFEQWVRDTLAKINRKGEENA